MHLFRYPSLSGEISFSFSYPSLLGASTVFKLGQNSDTFWRPNGRSVVNALPPYLIHRTNIKSLFDLPGGKVLGGIWFSLFFVPGSSVRAPT